MVNKETEYQVQQERNQNLVGVVGGVGPEASNKFCEYLIKNKRASSDQENISFLHYCNPMIPDRTDFLIGRGPDPTPKLIETCQSLEDAGAGFLVIPCNTAHYFLNEVQSEVSIPIVDMTKVLVKDVLSEVPPIEKIGILATTGSVKTGIYQQYFRNVGVKSIVPSEEDQENLVMEAVYGKSGIKAGKKTYPKRLLTRAARKLIDSGAEAIIMGCTEIPLVLKQKDFGVKLFDPMELTAKEIIDYLEEENQQEVVTVSYALGEFARSLGKRILLNNLEVEVAL